MSNFKIIVHDYERLTHGRMLKPKVQAKKGDWFLNMFSRKKGKEEAFVQLTRTQKRRKHKKGATLRKKQMLARLTKAKNIVREEVESPTKPNNIEEDKLAYQQLVVGNDIVKTEDHFLDHDDEGSKTN